MSKLSKSPPGLLSFSPKSYLFHEGDPANSLFLVHSGTISVRKSKSDGEIEIARIYANEVIGEVSFFDRRPRSAAAIALTETQAMEIPYDSLEKVLDTVPPFMRTILAGMAERLRRADEIIKKLDHERVENEEKAPATDQEFTATDALNALQGKKK